MKIGVYFLAGALACWTPSLLAQDTKSPDLQQQQHAPNTPPPQATQPGTHNDQLPGATQTGTSTNTSTAAHSKKHKRVKHPHGTANSTTT